MNSHSWISNLFESSKRVVGQVGQLQVDLTHKLHFIVFPFYSSNDVRNQEAPTLMPGYGCQSLSCPSSLYVEIRLLWGWCSTPITSLSWTSSLRKEKQEFQLTWKAVQHSTGYLNPDIQVLIATLQSDKNIPKHSYIFISYISFTLLHFNFSFHKIIVKLHDPHLLCKGDRILCFE